MLVKRFCHTSAQWMYHVEPACEQPSLPLILLSGHLCYCNHKFHCVGKSIFPLDHNYRRDVRKTGHLKLLTRYVMTYSAHGEFIFVKLAKNSDLKIFDIITNFMGLATLHYSVYSMVSITTKQSRKIKMFSWGMCQLNNSHWIQQVPSLLGYTLNINDL